jgi:hypothetical protein
MMRCPRFTRPTGWLALLLLGATLVRSATAGEPATLGRLFLSPEERRALDQERERLHRPGSSGAASAVPGASAGDRVVLNGVVARSHGPAVAWLNGRAVRPGMGQADAVSIDPGPATAGVTVTSAADGARARLKPGQAWDPGTGKVSECLRCARGDPAAREAEPEPEPEQPSADTTDGEAKAPALANAAVPADSTSTRP